MHAAVVKSKLALSYLPNSKFLYHLKSQRETLLKLRNYDSLCINTDLKF